MSSEEFCVWLAGFIEASNHYNLTPAGWQAVRDKLKEVKHSQMGSVSMAEYSHWKSTNTQTINEPKKQILND
jgi:hypothetical protein